MCLFSLISDICKCAHPQYLDNEKNKGNLETCRLEANEAGSIFIIYLFYLHYEKLLLFRCEMLCVSCESIETPSDEL